jgi:hypothetical protein
MIPLYCDPHFTFRFEQDQIIPRFHLPGVESGTAVSVFAIDPNNGERGGLIATAVTMEGGWVEVTEPIIVRTGGGFVVVADPSGAESRYRELSSALHRSSSSHPTLGATRTW